MTTATEPIRISRDDLRLDDPEGALPAVPTHGTPDFADQGYSIPDFFDAAGRYLGADCLGVRVLDVSGPYDRPLAVGEQVVIVDYCCRCYDRSTPAVYMRRDANGDVWRYCADHAEERRMYALADGFESPTFWAV